MEPVFAHQTLVHCFVRLSWESVTAFAEFSAIVVIVAVVLVRGTLIFVEGTLILTKLLVATVASQMFFDYLQR